MGRCLLPRILLSLEGRAILYASSLMPWAFNIKTGKTANLWQTSPNIAILKTHCSWSPGHRWILITPMTPKCWWRLFPTWRCALIWTRSIPMVDMAAHRLMRSWPSTRWSRYKQPCGSSAWLENWPCMKHTLVVKVEVISAIPSPKWSPITQSLSLVALWMIWHKDN